MYGVALGHTNEKNSTVLSGLLCRPVIAFLYFRFQQRLQITQVRLPSAECRRLWLYTRSRKCSMEARASPR